MENWYRITEEEVEYEYVSFTVVGDIFQGILTEKTYEENQFEKDQMVALFEAYNKKYKLFCSVVLENAIEKIEVGKEVKIIYKGMRKGKKHSYADYEIFTRTPEKDVDPF